jgi:hypothetical protein
LTPRQKREFTEAMKKTIAKKHRQQKEAEEFAASQYSEKTLAEQRAEAAERELARVKAESQAPIIEAPPAKAPARADFETDEAYAEALIDFRVDQKLRAQEAAAEKARQEAADAEILAHAKARIERATELVPDFKETVSDAAMIVPPHIASYMQESELFAEMGYEFAKNPETLAKLAAHTAGLKPGTPAFFRGVTRSLVDLGKIESKLAPFAPKAKVDPPDETSAHGAEPSTETGTAPSKPRSPAPMIRPLNAGTSAQVLKDPAEMKVSDHLSVVQKRSGVNLTVRKRH